MLMFPFAGATILLEKIHEKENRGSLYIVDKIVKTVTAEDSIMIALHGSSCL